MLKNDAVVLMSKMKKFFYAASLGSALILSPTVSALNIILNDSGGVEAGTDALAGFTAAAAVWENAFSDDVTVRLDVGFAPLGFGVLGSAGSQTIGVPYIDIQDSLIADITTAEDVIATNNLQADPFLDFLTTDETGVQELDNNMTANNNILNVNRANAKALGLLADDGMKDASITFSTLFNFDFDRSNGIMAGLLDFVGIAIHEIGHALGFVSGADDVDFTLDNNIEADPFRVVSVLDLFRYTEQSVNMNALDLQVLAPDTDLSNDPFFSLDGGLTNLGLFSTGRSNGDGRQASHWKDNLGLGIMDPTSVPAGQANVETDLDFLALDAIGWDLINNEIPEPSILALFSFGLLILKFQSYKTPKKTKQTID